MSLVHEKYLKMLPKIYIVLLFYQYATKGNISARQHRSQFLYNEVQCNTGGTVPYWQRAHFQILVNFCQNDTSRLFG